MSNNPGKAVHLALNREPGNLPASGRSCLGPGSGRGTVFFRLSDDVKRLGPRGDGSMGERPTVDARRLTLARRT